MAEISYLLKPTLGPPKKFQHLTRAEEVVITRLRIGHTKATKSHILSRGLPTGCHHCGQTLTIDHLLLECALLEECRDEYYTVDSLNVLFETIPETCIVEFLWEAGFFYLIWCNLLTSTSSQMWTIWSELSNCLENESNSETHLPVKNGFLENESNSWDTFTCVGRLICPEGHVSSLNKSSPIQSKSHILFRGPPTGCHHCGQALTIDHMLLECALLQECRDEYYTVDSLNALFETIPETCIVEFLRETGFFYLI